MKQQALILGLILTLLCGVLAQNDKKDCSETYEQSTACSDDELCIKRTVKYIKTNSNKYRNTYKPKDSDLVKDNINYKCLEKDDYYDNWKF